MIALIATVLNEGDSIHRLMRSLAAQTLPPDEVVICDGGSADNTVSIIESYADRLPLRLIVEPGANISAGRNRAIAAAQADIIAVTDAGVELHPDWLENLTRPLLHDPACQMVGGFFRAQAETSFELAMGATVLPLADEIDPATFLPSSRSIAFRKSAWEAVGGYPEWLDYCEDLIFDLRLKQYLTSKSAAANTSLVFAPDALVDFRPRGSYRAFWKQYYLYARGDGKADLWRKRHAARYLTYLVAAPLILLAGLRLHPLLWLLYLPGIFYYYRQPYRRLALLRREPGNAALLGRQSGQYGAVFLIRIVGDLAKMAGYPVGWLWRLRNRPPDWRSL